MNVNLKIESHSPFESRHKTFMYVVTKMFDGSSTFLQYDRSRVVGQLTFRFCVSEIGIEV